MLKTQMAGAGNPVIEQEIKKVLKEDSKFSASELRSVHRESLVVPVTIVFKDGTELHAFSRNISGAGICLVSPEPIDQGRVLELQIYRVSGTPTRITAEVRWCKPFGKEYYLSGWKFIQLMRGHIRGPRANFSK